MLRYFNNDKCSPRITFYLIIVNVTIVITANTRHPVLYVGIGHRRVRIATIILSRSKIYMNKTYQFALRENRHSSNICCPSTDYMALFHSITVLLDYSTRNTYIAIYCFSYLSYILHLSRIVRCSLVKIREFHLVRYRLPPEHEITLQDKVYNSSS